MASSRESVLGGGEAFASKCRCPIFTLRWLPPHRSDRHTTAGQAGSESGGSPPSWGQEIVKAGGQAAVIEGKRRSNDTTPSTHPKSNDQWPGYRSASPYPDPRWSVWTRGKKPPIGRFAGSPTDVMRGEKNLALDFCEDVFQSGQIQDFFPHPRNKARFQARAPNQPRRRGKRGKGAPGTQAGEKKKKKRGAPAQKKGLPPGAQGRGPLARSVSPGKTKASRTMADVIKAG